MRAGHLHREAAIGPQLGRGDARVARVGIDERDRKAGIQHGGATHDLAFHDADPDTRREVGRRGIERGRDGRVAHEEGRAVQAELDRHARGLLAGHGDHVLDRKIGAERDSRQVERENPWQVRRDALDRLHGQRQGAFGADLQELDRADDLVQRLQAVAQLGQRRRRAGRQLGLVEIGSGRLRHRVDQAGGLESLAEVAIDKGKRLVQVGQVADRLQIGGEVLQAIDQQRLRTRRQVGRQEDARLQRLDRQRMVGASSIRLPPLVASFARDGPSSRRGDGRRAAQQRSQTLVVKPHDYPRIGVVAALPRAAIEKVAATTKRLRPRALKATNGPMGGQRRTFPTRSEPRSACPQPKRFKATRASAPTRRRRGRCVRDMIATLVGESPRLRRASP